MHRVTQNILGIMIIVTTVGAFGQILLKIGMSQVPDKSPSLASILRIMVTNPLVICGLILFALNTVLYLRVLQRYPLSLVYPMIALSYVVVTLLAWLFLHEKIPPIRLVGLLTIITGVILMALSADSSVTVSGPSSKAALIPPDSIARP